MKKIILSMITIVTLTLTSCNSKDQKSKEIEITKPSNYTIVLDLSDRLLESGQAEKDIAIIEEAFKIFESVAKKNLILSSKDRFAIKLIPQRGSKLNWNLYENKLQLSLDKIEAKDKNMQLVKLKDSLHQILISLYKEAYHGPKSSDYFGVDIWEYLHNNSNSLSANNYNNTVLIITDGYFDFENNNHVIQEANKYTNTNFLNKLTKVNWKEESEKNQVGLLPIKLNSETKFIIAGVNSKKEGDVFQIEKLEYFWSKWLNESGIKSKNKIVFISNSSEIDLKNKIQESVQ
jgi:hypothetical protein